VTEDDEGLQMVLHHPIERRISGATGLIGSRDASLRLDGHGLVPDGVAMW